MRTPVAAVLAMLAAACSPLTAFNTLVPKDAASVRAARDIAYLPDGDPRHRLDIYAPRGPARTRAVVVFLYGGSWRSGSRAGYAFVGRALAAQGFVTVVPDYRLVPQVRFPAFVEDQAAAVKWVRRHIGDHGGDPDRIILVGHSAGAYGAAMLALDPRWLGADRAALRGWAGLAGPYDFLPLTNADAAAAFGHWADLADTQPIRFAGPGAPPTLLLHGGDDTLVKPRQSARLAEQLGKAGVPVQSLVYPNTGHVGLLTAIARPFRGNNPALRDLSAFVSRVAPAPPVAATPAAP